MFKILKEWAPSDRPRMVGLIYYSFRIMSGIGLFLAGLMLWSVLQWLLGKLSPEKIGQQKWLLRTWIFAAPLGYITVESGWIVRCVGRQPWTMYGQIRTADAASHIPAANVLTSTCVYTVALLKREVGDEVLRYTLRRLGNAISDRTTNLHQKQLLS
jgi:cytochrome d ubiquinol oxidase subunit I